MIKRILPKNTAQVGVSDFRLVLMGCGGTGSFLAGHIARLLSGSSQAEHIAEAIFVDGDLVEPKNIGRQLFSPNDVGKNKAEVLAKRYNHAYGLTIGWVPAFLDVDNCKNILQTSFRTSTILLGAVDTAAARKFLMETLPIFAGYRSTVWWLDTGNGRNTGQVVLGSTDDRAAIASGVGQYLVEFLPYPPLVFPELVDEAQDIADPLSCTELTRAEEQSLNINAFIATIAAEMLQLFLTGELSHSYIQFDLSALTAVPNLITDEWLSEFVPKKT